MNKNLKVLINQHWLAKPYHQPIWTLDMQLIFRTIAKGSCQTKTTVSFILWITFQQLDLISAMDLSFKITVRLSFKIRLNLYLKTK